MQHRCEGRSTGNVCYRNVLEFMLVDEEVMANPRDLERALLDAEDSREGCL